MCGEKIEEKIISENEEYAIKIIEKPNFDEFEDVWKNLQENKSLYMSFEAVTSYVKNYGNAGDAILIILEKKKDKSVEAIFPLRRKNHLFYKKYFFIYPNQGFNYGPLSTNAELNHFFKEIIGYLGKNAILSLGPVDQKFVDKIKGSIESTNFKIKESEFSEHLFVLALTRNMQDLLNSRSYKFRKNLRYYQKKVANDFKVTFENITNLGENEKTYEEFLDLHKTRIKMKKDVTPFEYKAFRDYILGMLANLGKNTGVFSIKLNGKAVCMILYADFGETRYFMNIGASPDYVKYSVGRLLISHVIEDTIAKGFKYFDCGQGDEDYKEEWGCEKFYNKNLKIHSGGYINSMDNLNSNIYSVVRYFMRIPLLRLPKKVLMNLILRKR